MNTAHHRAPVSPRPSSRSQVQNAPSLNRYALIEAIHVELLRLYDDPHEALQAIRHYRRTGTFPKPNFS